MSAFNALQHASLNFEKDLQQVSNELCSVRITNNFEDTIEKKLRDLTLLKTKLKLLRAKPLSLNPEISERDGDRESTLGHYSDAVEAKLIEALLVKSAAQTHAVQHLLTAPAPNDPDIVEKKKIRRMKLKIPTFARWILERLFTLRCHPKHRANEEMKRGLETIRT